MGLAWTDRRAQEISKLMGNMMYHQHYDKKFTVFLDCLMTWYSRGEITTDHKIEKRDMDVLVKMFDVFGSQDPYSDILGDVYEELTGASHKSAMGQFFTPIALSKLLGMLLTLPHASKLGEMEEREIDHKLAIPQLQLISSLDYQTQISEEPCVGSARLLLEGSRAASAERKVLLWIAVDADITCAKMTALNCVTHGIPAIIMHGNTLTGRRYRIWTVVHSYFVPGYTLDQIKPYAAMLSLIRGIDMEMAMFRTAMKMGGHIIPLLQDVTDNKTFQLIADYTIGIPPERRGPQKVGSLGLEVEIDKDDIPKPKILTKDTIRKKKKPKKKDDNGSDQLSLF